MIRPITCVCFLLACGSGLYLYQSKHRVQVLDREIEKTVHATDALREQTRVLHAEWTLLNDPQRLQVLADQFLTLKTVTPGQFTSMAELDNRLPAVRAPEPPAPPEPAPEPVAQLPDTTPQPEEPQPAALPVPPKPTSVAVAAPPPRPPERKPTPAPSHPAMAENPPSRPAPVVAEAVPPRPASMVSRPTAEAARPTPPRVVPVALPAPQPVAAFGGSALGMAHSGGLPPPRPMPVNASQWVGNGGGGG